MPTIGNIGIGLFVLIIIWLLALIVFVVAVRFESNIGWVGLALAVLITCIFSIIPLENQEKVFEDTILEEKDYKVIYKYTLLAALISAAVGSVAYFFFEYCVEPIRVKPFKSF